MKSLLIISALALTAYAGLTVEADASITPLTKITGCTDCFQGNNLEACRTIACMAGDQNACSKWYNDRKTTDANFIIKVESRCPSIVGFYDNTQTLPRWDGSVVTNGVLGRRSLQESSEDSDSDAQSPPRLDRRQTTTPKVLFNFPMDLLTNGLAFVTVADLSDPSRIPAGINAAKPCGSNYGLQVCNVSGAINVKGLTYNVKYACYYPDGTTGVMSSCSKAKAGHGTNDLAPDTFISGISSVFANKAEGFRNLFHYVGQPLPQSQSLSIRGPYTAPIRRLARRQSSGNPNAPALTKWMGCYWDDGAGRMDGNAYWLRYRVLESESLPTGARMDDPAQTLIKCRDYCSLNSYAVFGVESGDQCWCGKRINQLAGLKAVGNDPTSLQCNTKCPGDSTNTQICGGMNIITVYSTTQYDPKKHDPANCHKAANLVKDPGFSTLSPTLPASVTQGGWQTGRDSNSVQYLAPTQRSFTSLQGLTNSIGGQSVQFYQPSLDDAKDLSFGQKNRSSPLNTTHFSAQLMPGSQITQAVALSANKNYLLTFWVYESNHCLRAFTSGSSWYPGKTGEFQTWSSGSGTAAAIDFGLDVGGYQVHSGGGLPEQFNSHPISTADGTWVQAGRFIKSGTASGSFTLMLRSKLATGNPCGTIINNPRVIELTAEGLCPVVA